MLAVRYLDAGGLVDRNLMFQKVPVQMQEVIVALIPLRVIPGKHFPLLVQNRRMPR
jgi:hypothetical protein